MRDGVESSWLVVKKLGLGIGVADKIRIADRPNRELETVPHYH